MNVLQTTCWHSPRNAKASLQANNVNDMLNWETNIKDLPTGITENAYLSEAVHAHSCLASVSNIDDGRAATPRAAA
jgi:hypothetical protein